MRTHRFDSLSNALPEVVCIDVGASHYTHTTWWLFLNSPKATWIAVEPNPASLTYLNRWPWKARPVPVTSGLSEFGGEQKLFVTNVDTGSSLLRPVITGAMVDRVSDVARDYLFPITERVIQTQSLSQLLNGELEKPLFIKLDTQGSELSILRSVVSSDSKFDVVGIEIECSLLSSPWYQDSPRLWEVVDHLEPLGFELIGLDVLPRSPKRKISAMSRSIPTECDAIFALRRDQLLHASVETQVSLIAFYVTNNLYREASLALRSLPGATAFLAAKGCDVRRLSSELTRRSKR